MKKVFIQDSNECFTIDILGTIHMQRRTILDVMKECLPLPEHYMFVLDIGYGLYNTICMEFSLDKNRWVHISDILSEKELKTMREERLSVSGFWKFYRKDDNTTRADWIRGLTDGELANFLDRCVNSERDDWSPLGCYNCCYNGTHHQPSECVSCEWKNGILGWLES